MLKIGKYLKRELAAQYNLGNIKNLSKLVPFSDYCLNSYKLVFVR